MKGKLLTETFGIRLQLVENDTQGRLVARGQFGKADIPTANGRIYPRALWERELQKLVPKMKEREVYGELDHPQDGMTKLARVSHLITNVEVQDDGTIVGEALVLPDTRNGKQLMAILKNGGKIGVSSRGFGSVIPNDKGNDVVQDDFQLMTWDFVADPAAAGSFPEFTNESTKGSPEKTIQETEKTSMNKKINEVFVQKNEENDPETTGQEDEKELGSLDAVSEEGEEELAPRMTPEERDELVAQIRREEAEKAVKKISEMVKAMEDEIRDNIKSEVLSDPEIAGAKSTMESVKKILRPYIIGEDISEEIGVREKMIESLKNDVKEKATQLGEYARLTKELGFKLNVERKISDSPYKSEIRHTIGDVNRFSSLAELDTKINTVLEGIKKQQSRFEDKQKEKDVIIEQLNKKVEKLQEMNEKAVRLAEQFGVSAYVSKVTEGNEYSQQIKALVEERKCRTADEVDSIVEQFKIIRRGSLASRIQKRFTEKKERVPSQLVEEQLKETRPSNKRSEELLPGYTMDDVITMSTLDSEKY